MALETPRLHIAPVGPRIAWRDLLFKAGPLIALIAYLSIASPKFGSHANFMNIGRQTAPLAMIAIGQTFVILTGGIDLSVAAIAAFASAVTAVLMTAPLHLFGIDFGYLPILFVLWPDCSSV
jgi:ribose transport system permease protein